MKKIATLLLAALVSINMLAIPAHRGAVQMPQPDGTLLTLELQGDEFYHFNTTSDGYTVLLSEQGAYEYARLDGLSLVSTGVMAHDEGQRSPAELALLQGLPKRLIDEMSTAQANVRRVKRNVDLSNFDFENFRGLVILINFKDKKFAMTDPQAFYTDMFNTEGLSSFYDAVRAENVTCPGSVTDYFKDQSNGAFTPPFDVYGPYTTSYNAVQADSRNTQIFNAILSTSNHDIDFSRYDNNSDGKIDMVFFLCAGYSSSFGGNNSGYLWPHASNLSWTNRSYDGKWIDRYACSTELYGYEAYPNTVAIEGIGTVCHEFSHVLGLPDFYDTDYSGSGGESHNPGEWDVMAGGSGNNYGRHPVGYTFYERYALGWANPTTITTPGSYTLNPVNTSREGFILRTPVDNEFFTIENRQKTGWDAYVPGHGMIVTRVDSTDLSVWAQNKINCNPAHNYFEMLRAGNTTSGDLSSDPFPGSLGNPMLTNESAPNLVTWGGYGNDFNIVGIAEHGDVITFNVVEEGSLQMLVEDFEAMPATSGTTDANVEGTFTNWTFNKSGVRAPGEDKANGEHSVMMKLPSQFYSVQPIYYNCYMASMAVFNSASTSAKYTLEYSFDSGATWTKAQSASGAEAAEVSGKSSGYCYWNLDLANTQGVTFRVSQTGGNRNVATYVDDFTLYYNGEEGSPIVQGDVNGDGAVNIADINADISVIMNPNVNEELYKRADVNGDGSVNIADINMIISIIMKN